VYLAEQIHLKKFYALKILPLELSSEKEFKSRFKKEARIMATVSGFTHQLPRSGKKWRRRIYPSFLSQLSQTCISLLENLTNHN